MSRIRIAIISLLSLALPISIVLADTEYAISWGPKVGTTAPMLAANDQEGQKQTLDTLKGPKGLLVVFNRSVDW